MEIGGYTFSELLVGLRLSNDPMVMVIEILLYLAFFLNILGFFMQSDKQINATMLMGAVLLANVVAKLTTTADPLFEPTSMIMLIVNSLIFIIPMFVSGMSKAKKSKPVTIFSTVVSAVYFFMYWFFLQSGQV